MASLEKLRNDATSALTDAIKNLLGPEDEGQAESTSKDVPPEAKQLEARRKNAICNLWEARFKLRQLSMDAVKLLWDDPDSDVMVAYLDAIDSASKLIGSSEYSGSDYWVQAALKKETDVPAIKRLREAQTQVKKTQFALALMRSKWKRMLASWWIAGLILCSAITFATLYYLLSGADHSLPQTLVNAPLSSKTGSHLHEISGIINSSTDLMEKTSKLLNALRDLFTAIPGILGFLAAIHALILRPLAKRL